MSTVRTPINPTLASKQLLELEVPDGVRVARSGGAVKLSLARSDIHVVITVPLSALEWFVVASHGKTGERVEDWCDYEGYGATPADQLDRDMANDVSSFVARLLSRELRLSAGSPGSVALEWKLGSHWERAIPLRLEST